MTSEAKEEKAEVEADPLHEARERYKTAVEASKEDRKRYIEDVKFAAGEQWPDIYKADREAAGRPVLVVDKLGQYVRQVVNDSRQSRPGIKVRPCDSMADVETAEILQGLCRHIEERSSADIAYDTGLECAVKGGMGFIRVITEYAHDSTFEQEIAIKRVRNPLSIAFDPNCKEPDGSDAKFCFVLEDLEKEDYEALYGDETPVNWETDATQYAGWVSGDKIKIAEYYYVEEQESNLHLFFDGTTATDEEIDAAKSAGIPIPPIKETRNIPIKKVMWCKMNGKDYLEKPIEWPGKYIPIVPVWGNEEDIDGEVIHTGMIHNAKGAQQLYNFSRSAYAERVALTPKAPYIAAFGQVEDYPEWSDANERNYSVLRYNPTDVNGTPVPPPQRQPAFDVPAGFAQDMQLSEHDIQASLGMYAASLGQPSNEKSGRAIMARERSGDMATFHYHDNLARAIRQVGRIVVDMAPRIYDTARLIRIVGLDGQPKMVQINPNQPQASLKLGAKSVYNIGIGRYDVAVSTGPSYTTRRQEAAEAMMQMVQGNPQMMGIMGDLMVKNMDWPGSDEMAERLRLMLPPQIQQAAQKDNNLPPPQVIMAQAQQAISQRDQQLQQAHQILQAMQAKLQETLQRDHEKNAELAIQAKELQLSERDTEIKAYDAETKRMQVLAPAFASEQIKTIVIQTLTDILSTPMREEVNEPPPNMMMQEEPPPGGFFSPEEQPPSAAFFSPDGMVNGAPEAPEGMQGV